MTRALLFIIVFTMINLVNVNAQNRRRTVAKKPKTVVVKLPNDTAMVRKARAGDSFAQVYMGECYLEGTNGVTENNSEAVKWFKKAALNKSPYGLFYLGMCYGNGYGVTRDPNKAVAYYNESIKKNRRTG